MNDFADLPGAYITLEVRRADDGVDPALLEQ